MGSGCIWKARCIPKKEAAQKVSLINAQMWDKHMQHSECKRLTYWGKGHKVKGAQDRR